MARTAKKETRISLETVLWNCRVALRNVGSTEKNRDAVISLAFLKFAGDKFEKRRAELAAEYPDVPASLLEKASFYNAVNVFYLKETARWSYLVRNAASDGIAVMIDRAMADIEAGNPPLKGALPLNLFASLGASRSQIKDLIDNVNQIDESRFQEEDLIGRVYEYFLQAYAASGTKEDGEFYTPACAVKLIAELIEPYSGVVYDPCCGSGGMFVQSVKFVERHNGTRKQVSIIGQEIKADTWRLCKMNLAIRGIAHNLGETNASTFLNDLHRDRKVDFIMANPPFNLKNWRNEDELTDDARFSGYPVMPPVSNANYAWILHILSKLDVNKGVAGFLLANGALNAGDAEAVLRKEIIERDRVEAVIVLPRDMFYTTDISVTLWILNMNKKAGTVNGVRTRDRRHEVLFMDLRRWNQNLEEIVIDKNKNKNNQMIAHNVADLIGRTPLMKINLRNNEWNVYLKLEKANPGGSMKDRMALSMIEGAEKDGKLLPGGTVIESSSGNTAIGLAIVSICKGYKFIAVVDHHASKNKIQIIKALGGEIVEVGGDFPEDKVAVVERERVAKELSKQIDNSFFVHQANNLYNRVAYIDTLAKELTDDLVIINELYGAIGTGGSLCGTAIGLKSRLHNVSINAIEPVGSIIFGGKGAPYYQSGTGNPEGADIPEIIDFDLIDNNFYASDVEAFSTCRFFAKKYGLLIGGSSGGVIYKAIEDLQMNKSGHGTAVLLICDSGERYLDTVFNDEWLSTRRLYSPT